MRRMSVASPRPVRRGILLAAFFVAFLGLAAGPVAHPAPVQAGTAEYMEGLLVKWINNARANRGVAPLRVGSLLTSLAGDRSATLAKTAKLVHPDCLSCVFRKRGISFSYCGEVLGMTNYPWGYEAARSIFRAWKGSSTHWGMLMSRKFKRIGIGVTYRSSNHTTWAAGELAG
jgi:uncharacterized protein YkwD